MASKTAEKMKEICREAMTEVASTEEFWKEFDDLIVEEMSKSEATISFWDNQLNIFVGNPDASGDIMVGISLDKVRFVGGEDGIGFDDNELAYLNKFIDALIEFRDKALAEEHQRV